MDIKSTTKTLAILSYHKIGRSPENWESWFYIPEETFVEHLSHIQKEGWEVLDVSAFLQGLTDPATLPERTVLLTFDDGYRSLCKTTLPWLQHFSFPAVVFVPTDFIGKQNDFDRGVEPEEAICDWDHLYVLQRGGISIQSHSASHKWFSSLSPTEQWEELLRSKALLENNLGNSVEVMAFPYGDPGINHQEMKEMMKMAGYHAACLYRGGPFSLPAANPYQLERLAMGPDTDLLTVLKSKGTD